MMAVSVQEAYHSTRWNPGNHNHQSSSQTVFKQVQADVTWCGYRGAENIAERLQGMVADVCGATSEQVDITSSF